MQTFEKKCTGGIKQTWKDVASRYPSSVDERDPLLIGEDEDPYSKMDLKLFLLFRVGGLDDGYGPTCYGPRTI